MAQVLGIDFGGTKILAGVVDTVTGEVQSSAKKRTQAGQDHGNLLERLIAVAREALVGKTGTISSVGIGVAGQVDAEKNQLTLAPNLPDSLLGGVITQTVERELGVPVSLYNDVAAAAAGEATFGAGKGHADFVCVFVGTGIGGAIYLGGKPYTGATNTAGELGHMTVNFDGRICGCGGRGHLEAYASRTAMVRAILGAMRQGRESSLRTLVPDLNFDDVANAPIRSKALRRAIEEGDELTIEILDDGARYLASGLASIVNFFNSPRIILGGGVVDAIDRFFERVESLVAVQSLRVPGQQVQIVRAALGDFSGTVGAAVLADSRTLIKA